VVGMGRYQGMDLEILSPDEITSRYPFIETHDLTGALYDRRWRHRPAHS
jgi:dimethylglycine dehydrogenase